MKNKLGLLAFVGILFMISLLMGVSYAVWSADVKQDEDAGGFVISSSSCFDIDFTEESNAINLENTYPMSDTKGMMLSAYTFTIKNICNVTDSYQINLDQLPLSDEDKSSGFNKVIDSAYLKISINSDTPRLVNSYEVNKEGVESNAIDSRKLVNGTLRKGEAITYSFRLWVDENATMENVGRMKYIGRFIIIIII